MCADQEEWKFARCVCSRLKLIKTSTGRHGHRTPTGLHDPSLTACCLLKVFCVTLFLPNKAAHRIFLHSNTTQPQSRYYLWGRTMVNINSAVLSSEWSQICWQVCKDMGSDFMLVRFFILQLDISQNFKSKPDQRDSYSDALPWRSTSEINNITGKKGTRNLTTFASDWSWALIELHMSWCSLKYNTSALCFSEWTCTFKNSF